MSHQNGYIIMEDSKDMVGASPNTQDTCTMAKLQYIHNTSCVHLPTLYHHT